MKTAARVDVADDIRRIYNADDRAGADRRLKDMVGRYHKTAPALASWLEENIPEALTVFAFPAAHRKRLRTNNGLERLNNEIKRRTRVATLFPNEASLLRLVSASRSWPMICSAVCLFSRGIYRPPLGCTTQRFSL